MDFFGSTPGDFGDGILWRLPANGHPSLSFFQPRTPPGGVLDVIIHFRVMRVKRKSMMLNALTASSNKTIMQVVPTTSLCETFGTSKNMPEMIDPNDFLPRYYQLANILRESISQGRFEAHQPIPSERQLEDLYSVSRTTIRQAIDLLIRQGYLYREHGRGTFVSPQKLQKGISELTSFTEDMRQRGIVPGQKILEIGTVDPPSEVRLRMELPEDCGQLLRIERLRLGDDVPMGLQTSFYVLPEGQTITREELEEYGSIYRMLQEKFHLIPTEADETLEVTLATPREAALLQIPPGSPLLLSERSMYSQYRRMVEFVKILYRGDRYRYIAKLTRTK
jgi:GntR family transcriptional regulator